MTHAHLLAAERKGTVKTEENEGGLKIVGSQPKIEKGAFARYCDRTV